MYQGKDETVSGIIRYKVIQIQKFQMVTDYEAPRKLEDRRKKKVK